MKRNAFETLTIGFSFPGWYWLLLSRFNRARSYLHQKSTIRGRRSTKPLTKPIIFDDDWLRRQVTDSCRYRNGSLLFFCKKQVFVLFLNTDNPRLVITLINAISVCVWTIMVNCDCYEKITELGHQGLAHWRQEQPQTRIWWINRQTSDWIRSILLYVNFQ